MCNRIVFFVRSFLLFVFKLCAVLTFSNNTTGPRNARMYTRIPSFPTEFRDRYSGGPGELYDFWAGGNWQEDPRLQRLELRDNPDAWSRTVPIRIHGDGVPFTKSKSIMVLSCSSLMGFGASLDCRWVMTAVCTAREFKTFGILLAF